jgi:AcrR family transcriptional regulator
MCPRPYRQAKRQVAIDATRNRIIEAARTMLAEARSPLGFSVDGVAREADVARATIYYQFASKRGLYEALADDLAGRAGIRHRLGAAFAAPDLLTALDRLIAAFGHFWTADREIIRRLHALAALDPEIGQGERERNERRRAALRTVLARFAAAQVRSATEVEETVDLLYTLTSFGTFDTLAGPLRTPDQVTPIVQRLARAIVRPPP